MCGIVGAVSQRDVVKILLEGLKRLEYRGYDSAGIAVLDKHNNLQRRRVAGKVRALATALEQSPLTGTIGIAHTRWATHGIPCERNAHPIFSNESIAIVHNGIIENYEKIREKLLKKGYTFQSDTDTETVAHLIHDRLKETPDLLEAVLTSVRELQGMFALGIISTQHPGRVLAVRHGCPLVIGQGMGENFYASDVLALLPVTQQFHYLEEGDVADLSLESVKIYKFNGDQVKRKLHLLDHSYDVADRGEHRHYMAKEIAEQPKAISACLEGRIQQEQISAAAFGLTTAPIFEKVQHVQIVACGTSYHAAMVARYWLEELAGIPCSVEIASEFRYRKIVVPAQSLFVTLSQSGETADTLAALRAAKKHPYLATLAICNVPESSLVREADFNFMTRAGIEIGVASTKAFTTQLTALLLLTLALGRGRLLAKTTEHALMKELQQLPQQVAAVLQLDKRIALLSEYFADKQHALFLGRGALYPVALEGALKLKEISYIHAEGYPAGELKHGPLALIDKHMPVIAVAPNDALLEKLKSNLHEVRARGGELIVFADRGAHLERDKAGIHLIEMPATNSVLAPIIYTIPLQLLAYHVAILKGTDVDQPRNLAKSVTVE